MWTLSPGTYNTIIPKTGCGHLLILYSYDTNIYIGQRAELRGREGRDRRTAPGLETEGLRRTDGRDTQTSQHLDRQDTRTSLDLYGQEFWWSVMNIPGEDGPTCGAGGGNSTCRYRRRTSLRNNGPDSDRTARREGPAAITAAGQVWQVRTSWGHEQLTGKDGSPGSLDGPAPEAGAWWATVPYPVNTYNTQNTY